MTSSYRQQLQAKIDRITTQFSEFTPPTLEVFESPEQHFRMRAEFRIWHTENDMFYAMFERNDDGKQKTVVRIDEFPIADKSINDLMPLLLAELKANSLLSQRLFEIDFLATLSGEMLVTLIYHRKLNQEWEQAAKALAEKLNIKIMGRSRGQKIVIGDDFVVEEFELLNRSFKYKQIESSFTQPNAQVCKKMLQWACDAAEGSKNTY
ncbi:tRNA (Uracil-5-)-methyltransferase domain protein [Acinetobacter baumannii Naval-81]|nr:tRNA (Uracil-5-)-methyltransferase domain protein [Acinetobacter baumannii Naval-81]